MRANHSRPELRRRLPRLLFGLVLCGLGIAFMVAGDLGLGPWDVLHQGISHRTGIPIGAVNILVGLGVLSLWLPLRERPGLGTLLNAIVIGVVIDLALLVLVTPGVLAGRLAMTLAGPVLFGVGSGFYIGAGLGPGPRDGVMTGLARRGHRVGSVRAGLELTVLLGGWLLGGTVGVGTVAFALGIGPIVHLSLDRLAMTDAADTGPPPGVRSAR
jgi:uncharacterized membrane protein YczE